MEMEKIFKRECPCCKKEVQYKNKYTMLYAEKSKKLCRSCTRQETPRKYGGSVFQKEFWIQKGMTEEQATQKVFEIQKKASSKKSKEIRSKISLETSPFRKESWIKKGLTEEQAEFEVKCRRSVNKEFWIKKGMSEEEAIKKVAETQSIASKNASRNNLPNQLEYWIRKGYSENEAKQKLSERQATFTLEKCITKYGEVEGRKRWIERQNKWIKNYRKKSYSFISQELFWKLYLEMNFEPSDIKFATFDNGNRTENINLNLEEKLFLDNRLVLPDFIHIPTKKIIEFDGVYYHRNTPENKSRALQRDEDLKRNGYEVFHVNEKDYKLSTKETINKCKNFLCNR